MPQHPCFSFLTITLSFCSSPNYRDGSFDFQAVGVYCTYLVQPLLPLKCFSCSCLISYQQTQWPKQPLCARHVWVINMINTPQVMVLAVTSVFRALKHMFCVSQHLDINVQQTKTWFPKPVLLLLLVPVLSGYALWVCKCTCGCLCLHPSVRKNTLAMQETKRILAKERGLSQWCPVPLPPLARWYSHRLTSAY